MAEPLVAFRLTPEELARLDAAVVLLGLNRSAVIRAAIRGQLDGMVAATADRAAS